MKKLSFFVLVALMVCFSSVMLVACDKNDNNTPPAPPSTNFTITYDTCGGDSLSSVQVDNGEKLTKIIPTRNDYVFMGWYEDNSYTKKFDFNTEITKDFTLYAKWSNNLAEIYDFSLTSDFSFYIITGYKGESTELVLPRLYDNLRVLSIGENAFKNNDFITKITIPNTIEIIRNSAFANCSKLQDITIPNNVKTLEDNAFQNCISLNKLVIENGVESIGNNTFDGCKSLTQLTLPNSITTVGAMAFRYNEALQSIQLSTGMSAIGNATFQGCVSLKDIEILDNITVIGNSAFSDCYGLKNVKILGDITLMGNSAFYDCQGIENIYYASSINGDYENNGDNYLFYNAGLKTNGITLTLSPNAILPKGIFIPYREQNIPKITSVIFEDETISIDSNEFNRMPYLANISVPSSVKNITKGIFDNTLWYENQNNGFVCFDSLAYGYKGNLPKDVVVPSNITRFANSIFDKATNIESLELSFVGLSNEESGTNALFGAIFSNENYDGSIAITQKYGENQNITFYIPQTLKQVKVKGITGISCGAFSGLTSFERLDFSECPNLSKIEDYAFYGFPNIENIILPEQEIEIGKDLYENMQLIQIECDNQNGHIEEHEEKYINKTITLTAMANDGYWTAWYDSEHRFLSKGNSYSIKTKLAPTILYVEFRNDYLLSFDSNGGTECQAQELNFNDPFTLPITSRDGYDFDGWYLDNQKIENGNYQYKNDVELIAKWKQIFETSNTNNELTITGLTEYGQTKQELVIPNKIDGVLIKNITNAITNNNILTDLTIDVEIIGYRAFGDCKNLQTITIGNHVKELVSYAFDGCHNIKQITIGENVKRFEKAFYDIENLQKVIFLGTINQWAQIEFVTDDSNPLFYSHKLIIDGEDVVNANIDVDVNAYAFVNLQTLTTINFGQNVKNIGYGAFWCCSNLKNIHIGENVLNIDRNAFYEINIGEQSESTNQIIIDSVQIYIQILNIDSCGKLIKYRLFAPQIKVLKTIVDNNINEYLNNESNYSRAEDGDYYIFTKVGP